MQTEVLKVDPRRPDGDVMRRAGAIVRAGGLVAFPTETVYGLAADPLNREAVGRVFEVKGRPLGKPLPIQVATTADLIPLILALPECAKHLMRAFCPGPLTLIFDASHAVPDLVTGGTGKVGIRIPDHPVALALIRCACGPITAPSANISDQPPATTAEEVLESLAGKIEAVLDGGVTPLKISSTVVDLTEEPPRIVRVGSIGEELLAPYLR